MDTRDPLEKAVARTAALGSIERAYADGYAAAQKEIERLRAKLTAIHEISQDHLAPAWQVILNIEATARSALEQKVMEK